MTKTIQRLLAILATAATLLVGTSRLAGASCLPVGAAAAGSGHTLTQIVVAADAAQPFAIVRCGVTGARAPSYLIPTLEATPQAQVVNLDASWDALWEATAPRAVVRHNPSAMAGQRLEHDLNPPVAGEIVAPDGPTVHAALATAPSPGGAAQGAIRLDLDPGDLAGNGPIWLPSVRLPLPTLEDGSLALPVVPISPSGAAPDEVDVLILSHDHYVALHGFDAWEVVDRAPDGVSSSAAAVAPDPVLVVPNPAYAFDPAIRPFDAFYAQRITDAVGTFAGPTAILQYAGTLGDTERVIARPPVLGVYAAANRAVRVRLDHPGGTVLRLAEVPPLYYRALWVSLPDNPDATIRRPDDLDLTGDSMLFSFGAELPAELSPSLISEELQQHLDVLSGCDPGRPDPLPVDIQLVVEPGGTVLAVFVAVDDAGVGQCLIDGLSDLLFPLATGRPVAVRFPITYGQR
jgi:hypothetical protein